MHRTRAGLAATAGASYAFVLWGHAALADVGRFALFLACVTGALLAAAVRAGAADAPAPSGVGPDAAPAPVGDVATERDALRRLEAELHALEDQLASAPDPFADTGRAPAGLARG